MTTLTFDQVLTSARQLAPHERAELITQLARDLAAAPVATSAAWATMERLRQEFAHLPRSEGTLADQLERDRTDRQALLEGQSDVHA